MVICNLNGGLGNQMFQYAAVRSISLAHNSSLRLDISTYVNRGHHQGFELNRVFNCAAEIASEADIRRVLGWGYLPSMRRIVARPKMAMFRNKRFAVEPHFNYWRDIWSVPGDCYLVGYWQSEKYFLGVARQIREDFSFRPPLENKNITLANRITQVNAVSVHIRRGDYAYNPITAATHGLCSLNYYREAIQYISERVHQPYFFIFSDDIVWAKQNLKIDHAHCYVDHNHGAESYNDMRLMSMCKHNIIANSSFSWWGAWLNPNATKIVIAPTRWFANHTDVSDLLPRGWVSL